MRKALKSDRIKAAAVALSGQVPDALWIVGLTAIAFGVGMIFLPAGVIVAGMAACFIGYAAGDAS